MEDLYVKNSFCDLNVVLQDGKKANRDMLETLADYGYEIAALNKEVVLAKKTQLKPPSPLETHVDIVTIPVYKRNNKMKVLQRLTVTVDDASLLHALSSPHLESYDLLAVRPTSDKTFQIACSSLSIDLISVDISERVPFTFKQAQVGQAIERGVYFEICYSPAIRDTTARRNTLANALELVKITKGKNIIVSSQAEKVFDLRAPADVTNLCHLFGVSGPLCKSTITSNCRAALLHAAMRSKTSKGVVSSMCVRKDTLTRKEETKENSGKQKMKSSATQNVSRKRKRESGVIIDTDGVPPSKNSVE